MPLAKNTPAEPQPVGRLAHRSYIEEGEVCEFGAFFKGILANDSSYCKIAASVCDVPNPFQRATFGENPDSQLDTSWHLNYLQGVTSLEGCIAYRYNRVRQLNYPQGMAVSPRLWTDCAKPYVQTDVPDTRS